MSLLGTPLLVFLGSVTIGASVATVVLWNRLAGRGPVKLASRLLAVLACQFAAVLVLAIGVNHTFVFFSSWSELAGNGTKAATAGAQAVDAAGKVGGFLVGKVSTAVARRQGQLMFRYIAGPKSHLGTWTYVYLPPQYFAPPAAHKRFPVEVWLTGYPGTPGELVRYLGLIQTMDKRVAGGIAQPMVLVMLHPTLAPPRDTECVNVPHGPQVETYLAVDLPAAVRTSYRVAQDRSGWGLAGLSTGGFCAVKVAMRHPEVYSAAVSVSGYNHTVLDSTTGDLYGGSAAYRNENDPEWLLSHRPAPPLSVLVTYSTDEAKVVADTTKFLSLVHLPMVAYRLLVPSGGHNFGVFAAEMPPAVDWFSAHLTPGSVLVVQALPRRH